MTVDFRKPAKLYRYSNAQWVDRSLKFGEFRLRPATDYKDLLSDPSRKDDELVRLQSTDARHVKIRNINTGQDIVPIGTLTYRSEIHTNYIVLCFSAIWDHRLFAEFPDTNACLVIHQVEEFCEQIHAAAEVQLSGWVVAFVAGQIPVEGHKNIIDSFQKLIVSPKRLICAHGEQLSQTKAARSI